MYHHLDLELRLLFEQPRLFFGVPSIFEGLLLRFDLILQSLDIIPYRVYILLPLLNLFAFSFI